MWSKCVLDRMLDVQKKTKESKRDRSGGNNSTGKGEEVADRVFHYRVEVEHALYIGGGEKVSIMQFRGSTTQFEGQQSTKTNDNSIPLFER